MSYNCSKRRIFLFPQCLFLWLIVVGSLGEGLGNPYYKYLLWSCRLDPRGLLAVPSVNGLWNHEEGIMTSTVAADISLWFTYPFSFLEM